MLQGTAFGFYVVQGILENDLLEWAHIIIGWDGRLEGFEIQKIKGIGDLSQKIPDAGDVDMGRTGIQFVLDLQVMLWRQQIASVQVREGHNAFVIAFECGSALQSSYIEHIGLRQMLGAVDEKAAGVWGETMGADVIGGLTGLLHVFADVVDIVGDIQLKLLCFFGDVHNGKQLMDIQFPMAHILVDYMDDVAGDYVVAQLA
jgi:hypothetical protein